MIKTNNKRKSSFRAGMYLLENLTSGMYNDPLSIYREYIQNAVDSIDVGRNNGIKSPTSVHINLDPFKRQITIRDNGVGISFHEAEETLSSIGISSKNGHELRGFRGIGRLGGIAFSDKATFRTKARGEVIESVQVWDCIKLRNLIETKNKSLSFKDFFDTVTNFSQQNGKRSSDSYFEVSLEGVSSFRNHVFDLETICDYIGQVAPVPFNNIEFPYGDAIEKYLLSNLNSYRSYDVFLNDSKIFKPYGKNIRTSMKKGGIDSIDDIRFFELKGKQDSSIAFGWYGRRRDLLGSIRRGEAYSGIRVRVGNILIGDSHLLDRCFREERFNGYMIGEIHVASSELIPNSRRDDFIDNEAKTLFYNAVEKEIGLPISKEIRLMSRIKADKSDCLMIVKPESMSEPLKNEEKNKYSSDYSGNSCMMTKIKTICGDCPQFHSISRIIREK